MSHTMEKMRAYDERISPREMFRRFPALYSQFDQSGVPTHDASGNEIGKSMRRKLQKQSVQQEKNNKREMS